MKPVHVFYLCVLILCLSILTNVSFLKHPEETDEKETLIEKTIDGQGLSKSKKADDSQDSWNYFHEKSDPTLDNISSDEKDYDGIYK